MSRLWAWLAIGWTVVESATGYWWYTRLSGIVMPAAPAGGLTGVPPVAMLALPLALAYPIFVLVWFSREAVLGETARWRR